jgi:hypothetical protein
MTVLSLQWLVARPRRRTAVIRHVSPGRRRAAVIRHPGPARRERRTYRDSFFADPAAVEDDSRRMSQRGAAAR